MRREQRRRRGPTTRAGRTETGGFLQLGLSALDRLARQTDRWVGNVAGLPSDWFSAGGSVEPTSW